MPPHFMPRRLIVDQNGKQEAKCLEDKLRLKSSQKAGHLVDNPDLSIFWITKVDDVLGFESGLKLSIFWGGKMSIESSLGCIPTPQNNHQHLNDLFWYFKTLTFHNSLD